MLAAHRSRRRCITVRTPFLKLFSKKPGVWVHICNPSTWEVGQVDRKFKAILGYITSLRLA